MTKQETLQQIANKDLCLNCGKQYPSKLWGAECDCENPNVVHLLECQGTGCKNIIGYTLDDDYCGPELYCSDCINKSVKRGKEQK
jgi:hypothetical protein